MRFPEVVDRFKNSILMTYCNYGQVRFRDQYKHQVKRQNEAGETALIISVKYQQDYETIPEYLLQEVGIFDYSGKCALDYAIQLNKKPYILKLLQCEAGVVNRFGESITNRISHDIILNYMSKKEYEKLKTVDYF